MWHGSSTLVRARADEVPGLALAAELSLGPLPAPPRSAGSAGLDKSFRFTTEGTAAAAAAAAARVAGGLALEPRPSTVQGRTTFAYNRPSLSRSRPRSRPALRASQEGRRSPVRERESDRLKRLARNKLMQQLRARKREARFSRDQAVVMEMKATTDVSTAGVLSGSERRSMDGVSLSTESKGREVLSLAKKWGFAL